MDEYYKFLEGWKSTSKELAEQVYELVSAMPEGTFGVGKDWVSGYRRDLANELLDKVITPYNYFRDRKLVEEKEAEVEFLPADIVKGERKQLKWGVEGTGIEEKGFLVITYNDKRPSVKIKMESLEKRKSDKTDFFTIRIKDTPTNIFPSGVKDDEGKEMYNVHEYKPR